MLHHFHLFPFPFVKQTCWNRKLLLVVASCSGACSESREWILCTINSACANCQISQTVSINTSHMQPLQVFVLSHSKNQKTAWRGGRVFLNKNPNKYPLILCEFRISSNKVALLMGIYCCLDWANPKGIAECIVYLQSFLKYCTSILPGRRMEWSERFLMFSTVQVESQSLLCFEFILFIPLELAEVSAQLPWFSSSEVVFWSCVKPEAVPTPSCCNSARGCLASDCSLSSLSQIAAQNCKYPGDQSHGTGLWHWGAQWCSPWTPAQGQLLSSFGKAFIQIPSYQGTNQICCC